MDREQRIAAIVDQARKTRRRAPRALWVAAGVVGVACAIGFVIAMLGDRSPAPPGELPASGGGLGFSTGLGIGIGIGIAIGWVIAGQLQSSRSRP